MLTHDKYLSWNGFGEKIFKEFTINIYGKPMTL
jgi:hypothetical protein